MGSQSPLSRIAAQETLHAAWKRVRSRARGAGLDSLDVVAFERDAPRHLESLRKALLDGSYVPEPARELQIPSHGGKGPRTVVGLSIRDRIAQEATRRVLSPTFERLFANCSYAYRPGKGPQKAVRRVNHHLRYGKLPWAAAGDIRDFFASLDHELLLGRLRAVVEDEGVLRLIALWMKMGTVDPRRRWRDVSSGVRQGSLIAPLLANFYLHPFDQTIVDQGFALVRYADDCVPRRRAREVEMTN